MIRRVVTAAILIPLALAAIYWAPVPIFLGLISGVILLALREFSGLLQAKGSRIHWIGFAAAAMCPWVIGLRPDFLLPLLLLILLGVAAASLMLNPDPAHGLLDAGGNLLGILYIALPLSLLLLLRPDPGPAYVPRAGHELLAVLLAVWISDSMAYFVGRALGRRRLLPRLSPGKTVEGFIAGLIAPVLLLLAAGPWLLPGRSPLFAGLAGLLLALAAIGGDLFESLLKRSAGVKDSSRLLPGHGGVLDRLDSLLTAFPAWYVLATLLESGSLLPW